MTLTKEQIEMYASAADATQTFEMDKGKLIAVEPEHMQELARIALAALESRADAEPGVWRAIYHGEVVDDVSGAKLSDVAAYAEKFGWEPSLTEIVPPYTRPQPAPEALEQFAEFMAAESIKAGDYPDGWKCKASNAAYEYAQACRAAMLSTAPVNPELATQHDDTRRMDWLVSKTVDVREPLVYGSRSLFWSQTISDDLEEEHKTTLREQIDAAMLAAAPGKEG